MADEPTWRLCTVCLRPFRPCRRRHQCCSHRCAMKHIPTRRDAKPHTDILFHPTALQRWRTQEIASSVLAAEEIEEDISRRYFLPALCETAVSSLLAREQYILRERYGLNGVHVCEGYTRFFYGPECMGWPSNRCPRYGGRRVECIAAALGLTTARIYQIEATALRKLRHPTRSRRLKAYLHGTDSRPDRPDRLSVSSLPLIVQAYYSLLREKGRMNEHDAYREICRHYDALVEVQRYSVPHLWR